MKLAVVTFLVFLVCSAHSQTIISNGIELTISFKSAPVVDSTQRLKVKVKNETNEPPKGEIMIVDFPDFFAEYPSGTKELEKKLSEILRVHSKQLKKRLRKNKAYAINVFFYILESGEATEIQFKQELEDNIEYDIADFLLNSKWIPGERFGDRTKNGCTLELSFRKI